MKDLSRREEIRKYEERLKKELDIESKTVEKSKTYEYIVPFHRKDENNFLRRAFGV